MTTRDADGNPVKYCTGLCNVIVLALQKSSKKLKRMAVLMTLLLITASTQSQNYYKNELPGRSFVSSSTIISPALPTSATVDYYTFNRYDTGDGLCNPTYADIYWDDRKLSVTIDDFPALTYRVIYLKRSQGRNKVTKIVTEAETVAGEKFPPKYTWYYIPDDDKLVCSDTGITFHNER